MHILKLFFVGLLFSSWSVISFAQGTPADGLKLAKEGDFKAALKIWEPLAISGDAESQYYMGVAYRDGLGVDVDLELFKHWTSQSAFNGSRSAMFNLAVMYEYEQGVKQDLEKAYHWYSIAAYQGDTEAMVRAGQLLRKKDLLCEDKLYCDFISHKYYKPSAQSGNTKAMVYMANMIALAGTNEQIVHSLKWLIIADKIGIQDEFLSLNANKILEPSNWKDNEIAAAYKLASDCFKKYLEDCSVPHLLQN